MSYNWKKKEEKKKWKKEPKKNEKAPDKKQEREGEGEKEGKEGIERRGRMWWRSATFSVAAFPASFSVSVSCCLFFSPLFEK